MSDQSISNHEQPGRPAGWWLASDGRWYPPELAEFASTETPLAPLSRGTSGTPVASLYPATPPLASPANTIDSGPWSPAIALPRANERPPLVAGAIPPVHWPAGERFDAEDVFDINRIVAIAVVTVAALAIVGAFLPWVSIGGDTIEGSVSGWQRNDGKATVALAVAMASLSGMLFVGWRSIWAKLLLVVVGVSLTAVGIVDAFAIIDEGNRVDSVGFDVDFSLGNGIWITVLAGVLFVALSLAERSRWKLLQS